MSADFSMNEVSSAVWFAIAGAVLIGMTIISASLKRLPFTAAIVYLIVGILLGPLVLSAVRVDPLSQASTLRRLGEIAVIVSLFTAGLKLRLPLNFPEWKSPVLLATVCMTITLGLLALFAVIFFKLSWGDAVLLAAILAPTDPVLASDVQVMGPEDRDRLRFSLTAEAGMNDGLALPFVLLAFNLSGDQPFEAWKMNWLFDLLWGSAGGMGVGTILGMSMGWLVGYLRRRENETAILDDFFTLGLIGLSYGAALLCHCNGFLSVFAAGLSLRRRERTESRRLQTENFSGESGLRTDTVSGHMAHEVLEFNERLEHLAELVLVVLTGVMLSRQFVSFKFFCMAIFLIAFARPLSVFVGIRKTERSHKVLVSWFGIRGIGSLYYLGLALEHGVPSPVAETLTGVTLCTVVTSILVHGLSATPLMLRHKKTQVIADPSR